MNDFYINNITQVSSGGYHNCAINSKNVMNCWGRNDFKQIEIPDNANTNITFTSLGMLHSC